MKSSDGATPTFDFSVDGRSPEEVAVMKEVGYGEDWDFARNYIRQDGYFCGSCAAFKYHPFSIKSNPTNHDGYCKKYHFYDRDHGCCSGWVKGE